MWRKSVLQKLVQFGIEGNMLLWIQDFLAGRKIQVKLGTVLSDLRDCLHVHLEYAGKKLWQVSV